MKENLSKKLRGSKNYPYFDLEDVKEFIRLLKIRIIRSFMIEEHCDDCEYPFECSTCKPHFDKIRSEIDKLVGKELNKVEE